jgi:hypothetical protein
MTPTTTTWSSSIRTARPTISGFAPKRFLHTSSEITATAGFAASFSSAANNRPCAAGTPISASMFVSHVPDWNVSLAVPSPGMITLAYVLKIAMSSNTWLRARQSR